VIHGRRLALDSSKEMVEGRADTQLCKKHTRYFVGASAHSVHKRTKVLRSPDRLTKLLFEACGPCQTVVDVPRAPDTAIAARPAAWTVARALRLPLLALHTSTLHRFGLPPDLCCLDETCITSGQSSGLVIAPSES
jgi:hypothetical protein